MAKVIAQTMRDTVYVGPAGNLSVAFGEVELKAAAISTEVAVLELPIGIKVIGVRVATAAGLGSSVKFDIKLGSKVIKADVDVAAASSVTLPIQPIYLTEKTELTVVTKGNRATGKAAIMPEYVSVGF